MKRERKKIFNERMIYFIARYSVSGQILILFLVIKEIVINAQGRKRQKSLE